MSTYYPCSRPPNSPSCLCYVCLFAPTPSIAPVRIQTHTHTQSQSQMPFCCCKRWSLEDGTFIRRTRYGTLQYIPVSRVASCAIMRARRVMWGAITAGNYYGWLCNSATVRQCDSATVRWRLSSSLHLPFSPPVVLKIGYIHSPPPCIYPSRRQCTQNRIHSLPRSRRCVASLVRGIVHVTRIRPCVLVAEKETGMRLTPAPRALPPSPSPRPSPSCPWFSPGL
jgi:hypothetical protein